MRSFAEAAGPRREEYDASRHRAGISREMVWHQATPDGTVAVVYLEADDIPAAMQAMATSDDPFDQRFRELLKEFHGIDLTEAGPAPELVHEVAASSKEQSSGVAQINQSLAQVDQVTQRNASAAEELAATAEEMAAQAQGLQTLVGFFTTAEVERTRLLHAA